MLVSFLSHDLAAYGYKPLPVPSASTIGGKTLTELQHLAGTQHNRRIVFTAKMQSEQGEAETVVLKIGGQEQIAEEVGAGAPRLIQLH